MSTEHAPDAAQSAANEAARLLRRAATLAAKGQVAEAAAIHERVAGLLAAAAPAASPAVEPPLAAERAQPIRDLVIDALNELGVPSSPRAIAVYAQARFAVRLEPRVFASLRRDEQRTWKSTRSHRPVYIVPALTAAAPSRLLAMRGKLALSDWPLERRLVGPWSERVDHLNATINLTRQYVWLQSARPVEAKALAPILSLYASALPGGDGDAATPDPHVIEQAARAELEVITERDQQWRTHAASEARKLLAPDQQIWGVPLPQLLESTG